MGQSLTWLRRVGIGVLVALMAMVMPGCGKSEYMIEFTLKDDITRNYNVTYFAADKNGNGMTVQAVASVQQGKCQLKGITRVPTFVYVKTPRSQLPLVIYAEKGNKIIVSGDTDEQLDWNVAGNDINVELSQWRITNLEILKNGYSEKLNSKIAEYAEENPQNPVSLILLMCYYNAKENSSQYAEIFNSLKDIPDFDKWLYRLSRGDQLTANARKPAKVKSIAMRSATGKMQAVALDGSTPALLIFWQNNQTDRKEMFDSVKKLLKEFPDSAERKIADINLDTDSMAWRVNMRRDSLNGTVRFWAPEGLADNSVMKLKVMHLPYFIVVDKDGSQVYRGSELTEALKVYRKEMADKPDKKDSKDKKDKETSKEKTDSVKNKSTTQKAAQKEDKV